jgi:membrane-bound serine protease (ClpP class)
VVGAVCGIVAAYGLAVLPTSPVGLALLGLAMFGFAVDVQTGVPRFWTAVGVLAYATGSVVLFDGMAIGWLPLSAGVVGVVLMMLTGLPATVRSRFSTPTIGRESMIGEMGEAVAEVSPDGVVRVRDALWPARTNRATPVAAGDPVRVTGIDGLVLEIEPESGGARDYRERRGGPGEVTGKDVSET